MNNYDKEIAIAKTGLTISILIFMMFIVFVLGRINTIQHKQIRKDLDYIKVHQEHQTRMLEEMKFVEEIGDAVSLEPGDVNE